MKYIVAKTVPGKPDRYLGGIISPCWVLYTDRANLFDSEERAEKSAAYWNKRFASLKSPARAFVRGLL